MGLRRLARVGVCGLAAAGLVAGGWLVTGPAGAEPASSVDDVGWWTRTNQEPTIGGLLAPPGVEPGQLLVEGTLEGATAIAALRATLPEGAGSPVLTLQVASGVGGSSAVLLACQTGSGWTGAEGGAWDAKPSPDCTASVQGIPSDDETSWSFALAPLQFGNQIDVVLTPGVVADADGLGSAFRLIFEGPDVTAIEVSSAPSSPEPFTPVTSPFVEGPAPESPSFGGGASPSSFTPPASSSFSSGTELATPPVRAALPEAEQGATATAPNLQAARPLAAPDLASTGGSDGRLFGLVVVLAALGLLYWSSQQPVPERRLLSRFASAAPHPTVEVPQSSTVGGLGRFRRERTGSARRLGG